MPGEVAVRGLQQRYAGGPVLDIPEWTLGAGERCAVLGPSGSGKSTLLHILAGLQRPSAGEVDVFQKKIYSFSDSERDHWRGSTVGIVLQALHLVAHLTVRANVRLAQYLARLPQEEAAVDRALDALGVRDKAARRPAELSQGERQRVA